MSAPTVTPSAPRSPRRLRLRPMALRLAAFLAFGAFVNAAVAFALALLVDVSTGATQSAEAWTGQDAWTVTRWNRAGATYVLSSRDSSRDWSPGQATGPPDVLHGGDNVNAWASASADGQEEWLELEYARAVIPAAVRVFETCATGALSKVTAFTTGGKEVDAWSGADPSPPGSTIGTSQVPVRVGFPTRRVRLYFDSGAVPGWNEVDAVSLVAVDGSAAWAKRAQASSTYAARGAGGRTVAGGPAALAPKWARLGAATPGHEGGMRTEQRAVEARGWPMLALWANAGTSVTPRAGRAGGAFVSGRATAGPTPQYVSSGFLTAGSVATPVAAPLAPASGRAALPYRPIWPGLLANTGFYAVVLMLLHWALVVPRRFLREVSRLRRGCCIACGYDLNFDFVPGCPECGWRRAGAATPPAPAR